MKIALVTDGISPFIVGGMQQHSASLGVELVKSGHIVDLFHFVYIGQDIPTIIDINNFYFKSSEGFRNAFCCSFPTSVKFPGHYLWNSFKYSKWVFKHICSNKSQYDFIYTKGFTGWELLRNKNKINNNIKIGVKFHGYEMFQYAPNFKIKLQHFMLRPFVKRINKRADYVFSYGGKISSIISNLGVEKNKIIELTSAIDSSWLVTKIENNIQPLKFLFVGRYERRKGVKEINNAILKLSKNSNQLEFHFVGYIPEEYKIKNKNIKTIYHGIVSNETVKKRIYDSCDVLICPSYSEGMPNVILEAMSRGLLIIASDVGAVKLMVSSNNGVLLEHCDSLLIKEAIKKIISLDEESLINMKKNSLIKVEKDFLWFDIIKKTIKKIEEIKLK